MKWSIKICEQLLIKCDKNFYAEFHVTIEKK